MATHIAGAYQLALAYHRSRCTGSCENALWRGEPCWSPGPL